MRSRSLTLALVAGIWVAAAAQAEAAGCTGYTPSINLSSPFLGKSCAFVQNEIYTFHLAVSATTSAASSYSYVGSAGFTPISVSVLSAPFAPLVLGPNSTGNATFPSATVSQAAGVYTVQFPNVSAVPQSITIDIQVRVDGTSGTSADFVQIADAAECAPSSPQNFAPPTTGACVAGTGGGYVGNGTAIAAQIPSSIAAAFSPTQIVRGMISTLGFTVKDQDGNAMSASGATASISSEKIGATTLLPAQDGTLSGNVYTPNATPQSQNINVTVTVTDGAATTTAPLTVAPGAINALQLTPTQQAVAPGQAQLFTAKGTNANNGAEIVLPTDVTWSSSSPDAVVDANGNVTTSKTFRAQAESVTITATLKANVGIKATATLTILPTTLASCRIDSDKTQLAPADLATLHLTGVADSGTFDLTADATFSAAPPNAVALQQSGAVVTLGSRAPGTSVTVTASEPACPGGQAQQVFQLLAPADNDLIGLTAESGLGLKAETIVGGSVLITAIGTYFHTNGPPTTAPVPVTWSVTAGRLSANCKIAATCIVQAVSAGTGTVTATLGGLQASLEVDVDDAYLSLTWSLSRHSVQQGQPIAATLIATTKANASHTGVHIDVALPPGLRIAGPKPSWTIDVATGPQTQKFSLALLASARSGTWTLLAQGFDPSRAAALAQAQTQVVITPDPDFSQALLVGRVFDDKNGNGRADEGEPGIANAMVGLSSGIFVFTDQDGLYHAPALQPGSVLVKLDVTSLPHVAPLTTREKQVLYLTPGDVARADFGVQLDEPKPPPVVRDEERAPRLQRTIDGSLEYILPLRIDGAQHEVTVPLKALRNTAEVIAKGTSTGHYQVLVRRYGDTIIADDPILKSVDFPPTPQTRHFLVALGEGVVGFEPLLANKGVSQSLYYDGKLAFAYRGRILGKYLIDAGVDTGVKDLPTFFKRDTTRIFRNLDPEAYYPVYGDGSRLEDLHEGGGRLYVRVEAGPVMAKWGSFRSGLSDNDYGRYDRALYGASIRFLQDHPKGEAHKVIVFASQPDTDRAHDELYGTGSTLFYLSHTNVEEGSEQLVVERRAQSTGLVRARMTLMPGSDYVIDYSSGRVLLNRPLLSTVSSDTALRQGAQDGDEQWLLADYEVERDLGKPRQTYISGGRAVERPIKGLELGVTGASELTRAGAGYWLLGGDLRFHYWEPFELKAEYAHSQSSLNERARSFDGGFNYDNLPDPNVKGGDAYEARAAFHWNELKAEAYGKYKTSGYNDTTNNAGDRLEQYGGVVRDKFSFGLTAALSLDDTRRDAQLGASGEGVPLPDLKLGRTAAELELAQAIGPVTLLAGGRYAFTDIGYGNGKEAVAAGGAVWRIIPQLAIGVTQQMPVYRTGDRLFDSLGEDTQGIIKWQINDRFALDGGGGYGERGPSGRAGVSFPLWDDTQGSLGFVHGGSLITDSFAVGVKRQVGDGTLTFVDNQFAASSAGRFNTQSGGIEQAIGKHHLLSLNYESGERLVGESLAMSVQRIGGGIGYSYIGNDGIKFKARIEARQDAPSDLLATPGQKMIGGDARLDVKITKRLALAAWTKTNFASLLIHHDMPESDYSEDSIGLSYRPLESDKIVVLARYAFIRERLPREENPTGEFTENHTASGAALWDPWRYAGFMAKVAGKIGDLIVPLVGKTDLLSLLTIARVNGHITKVWDASAEYRFCMDKGVGIKNGALLEVSALIGGYVRLGAGYNFSSIDDVAVDCQAEDARGFFIRAQATY